MPLAEASLELTQEMKRLARHLQKVEAAALFIASTANVEIERALAEELQGRLHGRVVREFRFVPQRFDLPRFLNTLPLPEGRPLIFATGLSDLLPANRARAIELLNLGRETLRWMGYSVVLWVRPVTLSELMFQAPDFFAVRSGMFTFELPADGVERDGLLRTLQLNSAASPDELRGRYLNYIAATYRWLDFRGLMQVRNLVRLPLKDVFVPLSAEEESKRRELRELIERPDQEKKKEKAEKKESKSERSRERFEPPQIEKRRVGLAEAIQENQRLVVLGDPGSGKSTLLKYLALTFAEGEATTRERLQLSETRLPILIPLGAYALVLRDNSALSLSDYIAQHHVALGLPNLKALFDQHLREGQALVLLDGLDEVIGAETRSLVARQVGGLVAQYPGNRFVVTSRIAGYASAPLGGEFTRFTVRLFERPEIERFARQWSRAYESLSASPASNINVLLPESEVRAEARAKSLTQAIFAQPAIEKLAQTPLLLTLLALIHYQGTRLPSRRVELYRLCVEALAETWNLARSLSGQKIELWLGDRPLDEKEVVHLLAPVAYDMHERQPGGLISRAELEMQIVELLTQEERARTLAHNFVELVREQVGLLVERGPDQFAFMHLTFEEYLAARHLAGKRDPLTPLRPHLHDPRWREVILLTAASLDDEHATEFVRGIYEARSLSARPTRFGARVRETAWRGLGRKYSVMPLGDLLRLDLFLAARCLADDVRVEATLRHELVAETIDLAMNGPFAKLREEAENIVAAWRDTASEKDVTQILLAALQADGISTRIRAIELLGKLGSASEYIVNALVVALSDERYPMRAVEETLLRLTPALNADSAKAVVSAMLTILDNGSWNMPEDAAKVLGSLGHVLTASTAATVVSKLLSSMLHDRDNYQYTWEAVKQLTSELNPAATDTVTGILLAAFTDEDSGILEWRWRHDVIEALIRLSPKFSPATTETVIHALLAVPPAAHSPSPIMLIFKVLKELAPNLDIPSQTLVKLLLPFLLSESPHGIFRIIPNVLSSTFHPNTLRAIVNALSVELRDKHPNIRARAANALIGLGQVIEATDSDEIVNDLLLALDNKDRFVHINAAQILSWFRLTPGNVATSQAVSMLLNALEDEAPGVRISAAEALVRFDPKLKAAIIEKPVNILLVALNGDDWRGRNQVIEALGRIGHLLEASVLDRAINPLIDAVFENPGAGGWVSDSVKTLKHLRSTLTASASSKVVENLRTALQAKDSRVWDGAMKALQALDPFLDLTTKQAVINTLEAALKDTNRWLIDGAAPVLKQLGPSAPDRTVGVLITFLDNDDWYWLGLGDLLEKLTPAITPTTAKAVVTTLLAKLYGTGFAAGVHAKKTLYRLGPLFSASVSPTVGEVLLAVLRDDDRDKRTSAVIVLGQLAPKFSPAMSRTVSNALLSSLRKTGGSGIHAGIVKMIRRTIGSDYDSAAIFTTLGKLGVVSPATLDALRANLDRNFRYSQSESAFAALWQLAPKLYEQGMVSSDGEQITAPSA